MPAQLLDRRGQTRGDPVSTSAISSPCSGGGSVCTHSRSRGCRSSTYPASDRTRPQHPLPPPAPVAPLHIRDSMSSSAVPTTSTGGRLRCPLAPWPTPALHWRRSHASEGGLTASAEVPMPGFRPGRLGLSVRPLLGERSPSPPATLAETSEGGGELPVRNSILRLYPLPDLTSCPESAALHLLGQLPLLFLAQKPRLSFAFHLAVVTPVVGLPRRSAPQCSQGGGSLSVHIADRCQYKNMVLEYTQPIATPQPKPLINYLHSQTYRAGATLSRLD